MVCFEVMSPTVIRTMVVEDIAAVVDIERHVSFSPWSHQQFEESLAAGHRAWVARCDDSLAAYVVFSTVLDETELLIIAVDRKHQRRGFARGLLAHGLSQLQSTGMRVCYLEVRASNAVGIALYCSLGFEQMGRRPNYYRSPAGREHALLFQKQLQ